MGSKRPDFSREKGRSKSLQILKLGFKNFERNIFLLEYILRFSLKPWSQFLAWLQRQGGAAAGCGLHSQEAKHRMARPVG